MPRESASFLTLPAACALALLLLCARSGAAEPAAEPTGSAVAPTDTENAAPVQAVYPGVVNRQMKRGGFGRPQVSLWYPELGQPRVDAEIRQWAATTADAYEREVQKTGDAPGEERPESYGMWDLTGLFEISRPSEEAVSVTFNVYSYTGGAHGNLEITCLNYSLPAGRRLTLEDLFEHPETAVRLMSDWSQKELQRSLGEYADAEMIRDGVAPELKNFANLSLMPQGVRIEFQPYQVAPWAAGPQHVDMPLAELRAARPKAHIWKE